MARNLRRGTALGIGSILLWSLSVPVSRVVVEDLGVLPGAALVFLLGGGCLAVLTSVRERSVGWIRGLSKPHLLWTGPLFVAYLVLLYMAVGWAPSRADALVAGLANYIWPSMILVFCVVLLRERPHVVRLVLGVAAALLGIAVASSSNMGGGLQLLRAVSSPSITLGLGLLAGIVWALYSVAARIHPQRNSSGAVAIFLLIAGGIVAVMAGRLWSGLVWTPRATASLVIMALLPNSLAYWLWDEAVKRGDIATLGAMSNLIPILSVSIGIPLLSARPTVELIVGAGLVAAGSFVARSAFPSSGRADAAPVDR